MEENRVSCRMTISTSDLGQEMDLATPPGTALLDVETRVVNEGSQLHCGGTHRQAPLAWIVKSCAWNCARALPEMGSFTPPAVSAGGGDNMMAAIGTGNIHPGVVTASPGTSGTLFAFSDADRGSPRRVAAFATAPTIGCRLCTLNLTHVTEHVRKLYGWDFRGWKRSPLGAGRLWWPSSLPYLTGERTPRSA